MPKFIYTVIILNVVSWALWLYCLFNLSPQKVINVIIFLFLLLVSLALTFSVLIYRSAYNKSRLKIPTDKTLYRHSFNLSFNICLFVVSCLGLKAFGLLSVLNFLLLLVLLVLFSNFSYWIKK